MGLDLLDLGEAIKKFNQETLPAFQKVADKITNDLRSIVADLNKTISRLEEELDGSSITFRLNHRKEVLNENTTALDVASDLHGNDSLPPSPDNAE